MIIGEHTRENDLEVNKRSARSSINVRAAGKDEVVARQPHPDDPRGAIAYIQDGRVGGSNAQVDPLQARS